MINFRDHNIVAIWPVITYIKEIQMGISQKINEAREMKIGV